MEEKKEKITIAFYKGDIMNDFERKSDGMNIACVTFPKSSKYAGYIWYYPKDWIYSNDENKNDKAYSFNPDKRWIRVYPDYDFTIVKNEKNEDTGKWEKTDELTLKATELKELMKRPFKESKKEENESEDDE